MGVGQIYNRIYVLLLLATLGGGMLLSGPAAAQPGEVPQMRSGTGAAPRAAASGPRSKRRVHFVPNSFQFWNNPKHATTELPPNCSGDGCSPIPAYADVLLEGSNFVQCKGGPFALCYYSGPNTGDVDLSCELTADGKFANCNCYQIPYGSYFVDINAISTIRFI
jgi:hypothetical protein